MKSSEALPLVSVIITNYNYQQYIQAAIDSVLNQTYKNFELIIVDDGSTDSSPHIINRYSNNQVKKIFQKNQGQAAALNSGIDTAKGEFVAFLDSDDYWYAHKLERVISAFKDKGVVAVQHNLDLVDNNGNDLEKVYPGVYNFGVDILKSYFREGHTGFFCMTSGMTCRFSILKQIFPLDEKWKICADVAFTRPLPIFGKIVTVHDILGAYRMHGFNKWMNSKEQADVLANSYKYVEYTNYWLKKSGLSKQIDFSKSTIQKLFDLHKCGPLHPRKLWLKFCIRYQILPRIIARVRYRLLCPLKKL